MAGEIQGQTWLHSNTVSDFNVRCVNHSWSAPHPLFCTNRSTTPVCRIRSCTAVSEDMLMLCNSVEGNFHFHHVSFFGMMFLFEHIENPLGVWQAQTAHQSIKEYEFDDYIFAFATEISGKTTIELEDELEENCMTVFVRTINGKTISIKCDRKQDAATVSEKVERKTSIPRGMTHIVH